MLFSRRGWKGGTVGHDYAAVHSIRNQEEGCDASYVKINDLSIHHPSTLRADCVCEPRGAKLGGFVIRGSLFVELPTVFHFDFGKAPFFASARSCLGNVTNSRIQRNGCCDDTGVDELYD
jgi:hypothetical protein